MMVIIGHKINQIAGAWNTEREGNKLENKQTNITWVGHYCVVQLNNIIKILYFRRSNSIRQPPNLSEDPSPIHSASHPSILRACTHNRPECRYWWKSFISIGFHIVCFIKVCILLLIHRKNPYIESVYEMSELLIQRVMFVPYHNNFIYRWSPQGRRFFKHVKRVHEKAEETIKGRRQELERQNHKQGEKQEGLLERKRKYLDFLDVLLEARVS